MKKLLIVLLIGLVVSSCITTGSLTEPMPKELQEAEHDVNMYNDWNNHLEDTRIRMGLY